MFRENWIRFSFVWNFHFEEIKVFKAGLFFGHEYAQHGMNYSG